MLGREERILGVSHTSGMVSRYGTIGTRRESLVLLKERVDTLVAFARKQTSLQSRHGLGYGRSFCDTDCKEQDRAAAFVECRFARLQSTDFPYGWQKRLSSRGLNSRLKEVG
jgi:hypothetical protein